MSDRAQIRVLEALSDEEIEKLREVDPWIDQDRRHPREVAD
jgi:hypothetical protein